MSTDYYVIENDEGKWEISRYIGSPGTGPRLLRWSLEEWYEWQETGICPLFNKPMTPSDMVGEGNIVINEYWMFGGSSFKSLDDLCNDYVKRFPERVGRYFDEEIRDYYYPR
tara:strand:- start:40 stop:375 length:336 start_codon:yes stop_codon:yes gene_type:complete